ncbi:M10 family metallopeptidase C-terminal domain-containing protein, partial [Roseovarius sp. SYSU LYC5161]|uniref:M10 family metallopeptidase C-terminal domain-containing protein n=1 Tax=Roseovarius halophilus (ex Wu et al. 2025) TaxID=3376060 RepID=UPI00399B4913
MAAFLNTVFQPGTAGSLVDSTISDPSGFMGCACPLCQFDPSGQQDTAQAGGAMPEPGTPGTYDTPNDGPPLPDSPGINGAGSAGEAEMVPDTDPGALVQFSGDRNVDATIFGSKWSADNDGITRLTYSFPTDGDFYGGASYADGEASDANFLAFNAQQQTAARYGFDLIEEYTNIEFTEITESATNHANIRLAQTELDSVGSAYGNFPGVQGYSGDIWFGRTGQPFYTTPEIGNWGQATIMHEIGHALGLKHGHQDYETLDLTDSGGINYFEGLLPDGSGRDGTRDLEDAVDGQSWSLMTYTLAPGGFSAFGGEEFNQPQTFQLFDIAALQYLYGANYSGATSGNTTYSFSTTTGEMFIDGTGQGAPTDNIILRTIWDNDGTDTLDLNNYSTDLDLDLRPGEHSDFGTQLADHNARNGGGAPAEGNIALARLVAGDTRGLIENAEGGSGNDTIRGNEGDNQIDGNGGNDSLAGRDGDDDFILDDPGGTGNDTMDGDAGFDEILIESTGVYDLGSPDVQIRDIESVRFDETGAGATLILNAQETDGTSELDDVEIDGWNPTGTGAEVVRVLTDVLSTVDLSSWTFTDWDPDEGDRVEIVGDSDDETLTGTSSADSVNGNSGADTLNGGAGNDTLDGGGAIGDLINGGDGDDLVIYNSGEGYDNIDGGSGTDTYQSIYAFDRLFDLDNDFHRSLSGSTQFDLISIENVNALGDGSDEIIGGGEANSLSGGGGDDTISGNSGADTLNGGAGNDTLDGGLSVDSIFGDGGDDRILLVGGDFLDVVDGGADTDTLDASAYNTGNFFVDLGAGSYGSDSSSSPQTITNVENVIGTDDADTITGSADANILEGGDGIDTLQGGAGADTLRGGAGNDTLDGGTFVDSIFGDGGDDRILLVGGDFLDVVDGGADTDTLDASAYNTGNFFVDLGAGSYGSDSSSSPQTITNVENVIGTDDADTITGSADVNTLEGGAGADTLDGGAAIGDLINGGDGDDLVIYKSGEGYDNIDGGSGTDTYQSTYDVDRLFDLDNDFHRSLSGSTQFDLISIENVNALGDGSDEIIGGGEANSLSGGGGDDTISGNGGTDTLEGGAGADTLDGGAGVNDRINGGDGDDLVIYKSGEGYDNIDGGAGNDTYRSDFTSDRTFDLLNDVHGGSSPGFDLIGIENVISTGNTDDTLIGGGEDNLLEGGAGSDDMTGGGGTDMLSYAGDDTGVTVKLYNGTASGGHAAGDSFSGFENLEGGSADDYLTGDTTDNLVRGNAGDDYINVGGGDDTAEGGDGADNILGGNGTDMLSYAGDSTGVIVRLYNGTASGGHAAGDSFTGFENLEGGSADDYLTGSIGNNFLRGNDGSDSLYGGAGDDTLEGAAGGDNVNGGGGIDLLSYAGDSTGVTVKLYNGTASGGHAAGDSLTGVENLEGGSADDYLTGDTTDNLVRGNAGDDYINV